jgi:hypothetical protein
MKKIYLNKAPSDGSTHSLFREDTILENIEYELKDWHNDADTSRYNTIVNLIRAIVPAIAKITVEYDKKTDKKAVFIPKKA